MREPRRNLTRSISAVDFDARHFEAPQSDQSPRKGDSGSGGLGELRALLLGRPQQRTCVRHRSQLRPRTYSRMKKPLKFPAVCAAREALLTHANVLHFAPIDQKLYRDLSATLRLDAPLVSAAHTAPLLANRISFLPAAAAVAEISEM